MNHWILVVAVTMSIDMPVPRLAKWSLVDVFVIVTICTGVKIDQTIAGGFRFVLVGEPRLFVSRLALALHAGQS